MQLFIGYQESNPDVPARLEVRAEGIVDHVHPLESEKWYQEAVDTLKNRLESTQPYRVQKD